MAPVDRPALAAAALIAWFRDQFRDPIRALAAFVPFLLILFPLPAPSLVGRGIKRL